MAIPKIERLLNLVAALLETRRPISAESIRNEVEGYTGNDEAFRRTFERDKDELRSLGVPVRTIEGPEGTGYRILAEDYELHDLGLNDDERAALAMAEAMVRTSPRPIQSPIAQLGGSAAEFEPFLGGFEAGVATPPALQAAFGALNDGVAVTFIYGGIQRVVHPERLRYNGGNWYLDGFDDARSADRVFRLDRLESEIEVADANRLTGTSPSAPPPTRPGRAGIRVPREDVALGLGTKTTITGTDITETEITTVEFRVAEEFVDQVARDLHTNEFEREEDGSATFSVAVSRWPIFRTYVVSLLHHATVVGPEDLVADVIDYLRGCAEEATLIERPSIPWDGDRGWLITKVGSALEPDPKPGTAASDEGSGTRRPRQTATEQLARILAIVPWVAANPGVEMTEVCERFDISQRQLTDDLEHLFMVGVPPYTPDAMIDVIINDGTITVHLGEAFSRPLRLSTQQILALLVAGKAIGEVPGAPTNPALESALTKLAAHVTAADRLEVNLDLVPPSTVSALRDAIEAGATVGMRYYSVSKDETRSRWVDPLRLYAQSGHWYVDAVCHESAEERTFRVDRMSEVQLANADFAPTTPTPMPATANPASGGPAADDNFELVGIELPAASRWLLDQAYVARIDGVGTDRIAVEIPVNSDRWLGRFLVQIGPQAIVTGPLPLITAGRRAAQQALDGYLDRHSDGDRL